MPHIRLSYKISSFQHLSVLSVLSISKLNLMSFPPRSVQCSLASADMTTSVSQLRFVNISSMFQKFSHYKLQFQSFNWDNQHHPRYLPGQILQVERRAIEWTALCSLSSAIFSPFQQVITITRTIEITIARTIEIVNIFLLVWPHCNCYPITMKSLQYSSLFLTIKILFTRRLVCSLCGLNHNQ